ncbi:MAG: hypothetical protein U0401_12070 [Anaerolineae bacterium]
MIWLWSPWLERLWVAERKFVRPDTVRPGAHRPGRDDCRMTMAPDMFWYPEVGAEAAKEIGFRLMTGPVYFDFAEPDNIPVEQRTARGREFFKSARHDPLNILCDLTAPILCRPNNLREAQALADEFGVFLSTHAAERAHRSADYHSGTVKARPVTWMSWVC